MFVLSLESATDTMDLNALASSTEGAQAQAGLSGLGLHGLDVQWSSGAGDGAKFRGQRALPRDIDIPIEFISLTRAGLISQMDKLTKMLAGECTLRAVDATLGWNFYTKVRRVSGGDYATGKDTNGIYNMQLTITLRAGDPFWISNTETAVVQTDAGGIGPTMSLNNPGTVDAYATWEIEGPGIDFMATSPTGELLHYQEFIDKGSKIIIDTQSGTVVDQSGNNRYSGLAPSPKFWKVAPGINAGALSLDRSSAKYLARIGSGRRQLVTNPTFFSGTTGWTLNNCARDAGNQRLAFTAGGTAYQSGTIAITGLVVGQTYEIAFDASSTIVPYDTTPYAGLSKLGAVGVWAYLTMGSNTVGVANSLGTSGTYSKTFVATATTGSLQVRGPYDVYSQVPGGQPFAVKTHSGWADKIYIGEPGGYFDGDTTDTSTLTYSWEGTAHASISKVVPTVTNSATAKVTCKFRARKAMVV